MTRSVFLAPYQFLLSKLIEARLSAGIKQSELAAKLGRPQSFVSKFERGERRIDVIEYLLICRALDIAPEKVLKAVADTLPNIIAEI